MRQEATDLGITPEMIRARRFIPCVEASHLVFVELGGEGREHFLTPEAAGAWHAMRAAAHADGLQLLIVSAFRSVARQALIIRRKLDRGQRLEDILKISAPPGFSEHHTGLAVDIGTPESESLTTEFASTEAFTWLGHRAGEFGFSLSYPEGNPAGFLYEPWHWRFGNLDRTALR